MMQPPMISCPLKQTNEIDWVAPLKNYIRQTYGDDPERYSEECATLNRLRQDMRGAGKDSAAGRDLLYRYYGQLELLDLRFPVDENHIKISFTWYDAFTHKSTSQYSLAYEKASIIFNISAVLSCHAANQNRSEDTGLKTAYHSFQASAGMFTYINENFLHAPSTDLSRDTVKTLISIMLAQAQETFLEKQVGDGKKANLLAKLASQAAYLYTQAAEGVQDNVARGVFEKVWSLATQIKASYMASLAQHYQALTDEDGGQYGVAIARLAYAESQAKDALRTANSFPSSLSSTVFANSNMSSETGPVLVEMTKRHLAIVSEKLKELSKDNDFIYHQSIPNEASLSPISKLPASKAIPVSELYQGQDIQRIIGPDIFQKIVPMAVTEAASLYDEEKAKLVRAEGERVETANGEMAASLDYLKLPQSLNILKGGVDQEITVDSEFRRWCEDLAGHEPFVKAFKQIEEDKEAILEVLDKCTRQLDMEESSCEKMRSKYGADWTQQPSSRLTATLRSDIKNYRRTIDEASQSDAQLMATARQYEIDFDEMRSAGETDEADVLFQRVMIKAGISKGKGRNGSPYSPNAEPNLLDDDFDEGRSTVAEQIARVEELLKKLNLVKKERTQVLRDLKEKVHNDDISNVLILNKKSITNHESQLFKTELEKFRPHQNRLIQANHKQSALMKELTKTYSDLLQDKRVRSEQSRYEVITRQRATVMSKYKKVYQAFNDLIAGLMRAQGFYSEMGDTVDSLEKNVETFISNRRSEGAQLLDKIERDKASNATGQADKERERLRELMERMSMEPVSTSSPTRSKHRPSSTTGSVSNPRYSHPSKSPSHSQSPRYNQPQNLPSHSPSISQPSIYPHPVHNNGIAYTQQGAAAPLSEPYNPMAYPFQTPQTASPPPNQQFFQIPQQNPYAMYPPAQNPYGMPAYIPPPPPGPPPGGQPQYGYPTSVSPYPGQGQQIRQHPGTQGQGQAMGQGRANDPWAGLNAWK
ncbi:MAG: bck1-like resistance to osmotic shock [Cirrosporium novae-zelandiae]|nr:MAG: bck1-like resistance to osmotic shock [Cirrosporium novae-zelandiae]